MMQAVESYPDHLTTKRFILGSLQDTLFAPVLGAGYAVVYALIVYFDKDEFQKHPEVLTIPGFLFSWMSVTIALSIIIFIWSLVRNAPLLREERKAESLRERHPVLTGVSTKQTQKIVPEPKAPSPKVFGVVEALLPPTPVPERVLVEAAPASNTVLFNMERTVLKPAVEGIYPGGTPKDFPFLVHDCYEFFNLALFAGVLKPCVILIDDLNPKGNSSIVGQAGGYQQQKAPMMVNVGGQLVPLQAGNQYDRISMDIAGIESRPFQVSLATFAHEICHLMQYRFSDDTGHGPYWVSLMRKIGLPPVSGDADGKFRDSVSHTIKVGGLFDQAAQHLIQHWNGPYFPPLELRRKN